MYSTSTGLSILPIILGFAQALPTVIDATHHPSSPPQVTLDYATYQGLRDPVSGVDQYLGMRYAAAPLGDLRFSAPVDPVKTHGVQNVTEFQPICVGVGQQVGNGLEEDCLFINVFTPSTATPESNLPVWFYIPGGGYATQSNNNYNGSDVVQDSGHNVILVNINYRVGALGFLSSEKVIQDGGDLNVGLLDQRKALKWVQKYIKQFGGNPRHVVIHGPSAGGGSVSHQLVAYGGRDEGLFVGASPESPFWPTLRTISEQEFLFERFVEGTGCSGAYNALTCLRGLPIETIQASNVVSPFPGGSSSPLPLWSFLPVVDHDLIPDQLYKLFEQGRFVRVPTLVGDDTNEGTYFTPNCTSADQVKQFMKNNYPGLTPSQLDAIIKAYPLSSLQPLLPDHAPYYSVGSAAYGDSTFTCPGNTIASAMTRYMGTNSVWNYRYNVADPVNEAEGLGVPHTWETEAIFGVGETGGSGAASYAPGGINANVVPLTMDYWISFVRSLNPNTYREAGSPEWENWRSSSLNGAGARRLRIMTNATVMESVPNDMVERCSLWMELASAMEL